MNGINGRILGLDYGDKTVGVAVSDPTRTIASGVEIIRRKQANKLRRTFSRIEELCRENNIEYIVLGLPMLEDGSEGERCEKTRLFATELRRRTNLDVVFSDERFTTYEAYEVMKKLGIKRDDYKQYVDEIAAVIILQEYIDNNGKT